MSTSPSNPPSPSPPAASDGRPTRLILLTLGCVVVLIAAVVFSAVRSAGSNGSDDADGAAGSNQTDRGQGADQGTGKKADPVPLPDPCDAVPAEAVAAILSEAAPLPIPIDNKEGDPGQCTWVGLITTDPPVKRYVTVEFIDSDRSIADWKKANDDPQEVSGLGEHAYSFAWSTDAAYGVYEPEGGVTVYFAHGDLIARVAVGGWDSKGGEVRAADPETELASAVELARAIGKEPSPSGPFERPYVDQDAHVDDELDTGGCDEIPADLLVRFMGKKPGELESIGDEPCRLASDFQRPGPKREASRTLTVDFEEFASSDDAGVALRKDILIETKKFLDITVVRELPDLGDEAYLLSGRSSSAFDQVIPDQTRAQVLIRRDQRVLRVEFAGQDFPPGVNSYLENPTYEPIPAEDASTAVLELTEAYLTGD